MKNYEMIVTYLYDMLHPSQYADEYDLFCKEYVLSFGISNSVIVSEEELVMMKLKYPNLESFMRLQEII